MANKVIMTGRLSKDPERRVTQSDTSIATFSIAVDRKFKKDGQPTADFFNVIAFGKTGEFVVKYFSKGKPIYVEGSLQTRSWDGDDGKKRYVTEIIADNVEFCGNKETSQSTGAQYTPPMQSYIDTTPDSDDELPF